jgi:hypothetical protein
MGLFVDNGRGACGIAVSGGCSQACLGLILLCTELYDNGKVALHVGKCVGVDCLERLTLLLIYVHAIADCRCIRDGSQLNSPRRHVSFSDVKSESRLAERPWIWFCGGLLGDGCIVLVRDLGQFSSGVGAAQL